MEALFATLTDEQRVNTLNRVYQKGLSTAKENLAFSADKLVYLKPFITKLQNDNGVTQDLNSRLMARQIIDELLQDILDEITFHSNSEAAAQQLAMEYGLTIFLTPYSEDYYAPSKVA